MNYEHQVDLVHVFHVAWFSSCSAQQGSVLRSGTANKTLTGLEQATNTIPQRPEGRY